MASNKAGTSWRAIGGHVKEGCEHVELWDRNCNRCGRWACPACIPFACHRCLVAPSTKEDVRLYTPEHVGHNPVNAEILKKYKVLAKQTDDLKFVLMKYGNSLGKALQYVQDEHHRCEARCARLAKKLDAMEMVKP